MSWTLVLVLWMPATHSPVAVVVPGYTTSIACKAELVERANASVGQGVRAVAFWCSEVR